MVIFSSCSSQMKNPPKDTYKGQLLVKDYQYEVNYIYTILTTTYAKITCDNGVNYRVTNRIKKLEKKYQDLESHFGKIYFSQSISKWNYDEEKILKNKSIRDVHFLLVDLAKRTALQAEKLEFKKLEKVVSEKWFEISPVLKSAIKDILK